MIRKSWRRSRRSNPRCGGRCRPAVRRCGPAIRPIPSRLRIPLPRRVPAPTASIPGRYGRAASGRGETPAPGRPGMRPRQPRRSGSKAGSRRPQRPLRTTPRSRRPRCPLPGEASVGRPRCPLRTRPRSGRPQRRLRTRRGSGRETAAAPCSPGPVVGRQRRHGCGSCSPGHRPRSAAAARLRFLRPSPLSRSRSRRRRDSRRALSARSLNRGPARTARPPPPTRPRSSARHPPPAGHQSAARRLAPARPGSPARIPTSQPRTRRPSTVNNPAPTTDPHRVDSPAPAAGPPRATSPAPTTTSPPGSTLRPGTTARRGRRRSALRRPTHGSVENGGPGNGTAVPSNDHTEHRDRRRPLGIAIGAVVVILAAVLIPMLRDHNGTATPKARPTASRTPQQSRPRPAPTPPRRPRPGTPSTATRPAGRSASRRVGSKPSAVTPSPSPMAPTARCASPSVATRRRTRTTPPSGSRPVVQAGTPGYDFMRIARVTYRGWPTADWEYRAGSAPTRTHTLIRSTVPDPEAGLRPLLDLLGRDLDRGQGVLRHVRQHVRPPLLEPGHESGPVRVAGEVTDTLPLGVLDFVGIEHGESAHAASLGAVDIAQAVEAPATAATGSPSTTTCRASRAAPPRSSPRTSRRKTERIRVGAAGIMLPNHAPFKVAEMFRTLMAMHPGRIDLCLGRAPGTDPLTAHVLRRGIDIDPGAEFPSQVAELLAFLGDGRFPAGPPVPAAGRGARRWTRCRSCSCSARAATGRSSPPSTG